MGRPTKPAASSPAYDQASGLGGNGRPPQVRTAVLVPVKAFDLAKGRLANRLSPHERSMVAKAMARRVLEAASPLPTFVVCDTDDVAKWAESLAAEPLWSPVAGLNPAITYGRDALRHDFEQIIVAHADLPLATDLCWLTDFDGVTIVQDRRANGTNVMALPTAPNFQFCYGEASSALHHSEAKRLGLPVQVINDHELGWDVDTGSDFDQLPSGTFVLPANGPNDELKARNH